MRVTYFNLFFLKLVGTSPAAGLDYMGSTQATELLVCRNILINACIEKSLGNYKRINQERCSYGWRISVNASHHSINGEFKN